MKTKFALKSKISGDDRRGPSIHNSTFFWFKIISEINSGSGLMKNLYGRISPCFTNFDHDSK